MTMGARQNSPAHSGQMASLPVSPVRMRITSSMLETKILPSPMRPVWAALRMASIAASAVSSAENDFDLHLRQKVNDVFGAAIELRVALLATETLGFGDSDALQADFLKGFLHFIKLEGLDDRFDLFHENQFSALSCESGQLD
jgi:hypothetical protein